MADKKTVSKYKYKLELIYIDSKSNTIQNIKNECIKSLVIDHNYIDNVMPVLYLNLSLDKQTIDHMILHINENLFTLAIYKYDELSNYGLEVECFRKKFTYFLPDDINKNDPIDYNEGNSDITKGDTYRQVSIGLLCIDHINNNKRSYNLNMKNTSMFDCTKYCLSHINNMIIEPFNYNDTFEQLIINGKDSVNKTLKYLNNYRVFYKTPYRFYQDFKYTYLISSSGKAVSAKNDKINNVIIDVKNIIDDEANDPGVIINKTTNNYHLVVSYLNTDVYDNSIVNKSKTKIKGITSTGNTTKTLNNKASYSKDKINNVRINNDNVNMLENIEADANSSNVFISINKNDLDTDIFTINKRITISNIDRYKDKDGVYLLLRKRETYIRADESFYMNTVLNLKRIEKPNQE